MTVETTASSGTSACIPRYAPWLQKALRIKQQSEDFWTTQQEKQRQSSLPSSALSGTDAMHVPHASLKRNDHDKREPESVWAAIAMDDVDYVRVFLETEPKRVFARRDSVDDGGGGVTLLHEAASHNALAVTALLLDVLTTQFPPEACRSALTCIDTHCGQTTPLIAACRSSEGSMLQRLKVVRLLVSAGSDIAQQDAHGDNALHWCARESHATLLRFFLKETDAGVVAVFTENYKREKPLDIAIRQLARKPSVLATATFSLLRHVDRNCNIRLKLQVVKRFESQRRAETIMRETLELYAALERASATADRAHQMWTRALQQAEANRQTAENAHVDAAAQAASCTASAWLETKDGKIYVQKQLASATQELKLGVQSGKLAKPKDMKKAVMQHVQETYCSEQVAVAKRRAVDVFRTTTPSYPRESATPAVTLRGMLSLSMPSI